MEIGSAVAALRDRMAPEDLFSDPVDDAIADALREIATWERQGIQVLTMGHECYPQRLKDVFDRPAIVVRTRAGADARSGRRRRRIALCDLAGS